LLCGCVTTHDPERIDTKFDEGKRDWAKVFKREMKIAVDNQDKEAYDFFFEEYMRFRIEQYKEARKK
jgi:hypothetical protein